MQAVDHGIAGKWFSTGHDFVEDAPERKNVRPLIDGAAQRLFGRHVTDGSHHRAGLAAVQDRGGDLIRILFGVCGWRFNQLRQSEIEDLRVTIAIYHDVVGLEIAVDDPGRMRFG